MQYDDSEGPTKEDNGDSDPSIMYRESDINEQSEKVSGWTNPLSWTDDGEDDDQVVDMKFESLDEDREEPWKAEVWSYQLEDEIKTSMSNEM